MMPVRAEPTNVPCARCGAPMREAGSSHLDATVAMVCGNCGACEKLPADSQRRVLALRQLLVQRKWAEDAANGPAVAYLRIVESAGMFVGPYLYAAVMMIAVTVYAGGVYSWVPFGVIGGAAVASAVAFAMARKRLRATLSPLIRAWPGPAGFAHRCRRCGGELARLPGAFVTCAYCAAPNLVSQDSAARQASVLRDETADRRLYAAGTAEVVAAAGRFVQKAFTTAFFVGVGAGGVLAWCLGAL